MIIISANFFPNDNQLQYIIYQLYIIELVIIWIMLISQKDNWEKNRSIDNFFLKENWLHPDHLVGLLRRAYNIKKNWTKKSNDQI